MEIGEDRRTAELPPDAALHADQLSQRVRSLASSTAPHLRTFGTVASCMGADIFP